MSQPEPHAFGYELTSKQVRCYKVNDLKSVDHAVRVNIQEYLDYLGFEEETLSMKTMLLTLIVLLANTAYMGYSAKMWAEHVTNLVLAGVVNIVCVVWVLKKVFLRHPSDAFFIGTGVIKYNKENKKSYFDGLKGQRWCITLNDAEWSSTLCLSAMILGETTHGNAMRERCSVSREVVYSKYFTSDGFIYPPALTQDVDSLLGDLVRECKNKTDNKKKK